MEQFRAIAQQFFIAQGVSSEAQQLQASEAVLLARMAQALFYDSFRHIGTPAGERLKNAEVDVIQLGAAGELIQQPVSGVCLVAEACGHHQIRQRSVLIDQALNLRPTLIGQHSKLFA